MKLTVEQTTPLTDETKAILRRLMATGGTANMRRANHDRWGTPRRWDWKVIITEVRISRLGLVRFHGYEYHPVSRRSWMKFEGLNLGDFVIEGVNE